LAVATIRADLGDPPPDLPRIRVGSNPERAAHAVRKWLEFGVDEQLACRSASECLASWRRTLEKRGILVFALPLGSDGIRGFSVWDEMAPQVGYSTAWNVGARMFTLIHELGHLVTRTDSACLDPHALSGVAVERWCDRFAAAVLMPFARFRKEAWALGGGKLIEDVTVLAQLAQRFRTSLSATALRLVELGLADRSLFDGLPAGRDDKSRGGAPGAGRTRVEIRRDEYGHATLQAFVRAVARDALPRSEVIRYLDISDSNLDDIEQLVA
jgi:Zn-dependent peptidase ImmA (M78 family)